MRNLQIKILVAVTAFTFAFAFGTLLQKCYPRLFRQPVSLCTVTKYRSVYQTLRGNDIVTLKGYLYGGEFFSFGDIEPNACEYSGAEVEVDEQKNKAFSEMHDLLNELRTSRNNEEFSRVEVEIVGRLKEREHYCFTSRYVIEVDAISPVSSLEVVDAANLFRKTEDAR
jgi:hypothetical protein